MKWELNYSNQVIKFVKKNKFERLDNLIIKFIKKIVEKKDVNLDVKKMKGVWKGFYRIKIENIRIILRLDIKNKVILVHKIGNRESVYK